MNVWGITHRGAVREQNQDAYDYRRLEDSRVIALVCDGMGGARAGNVASTLAVDTFMQVFLSQNEGAPDDQKRMESAAEQANSTVFHRSNTDPECRGMGTTMVAVLAGNGQALFLNEGDSRAYHINASGIQRVTRDHSLVEDLVQRGDLTREQARVHPHKNLITRALGSESRLRADFFRRDLKPGDYLLLCSDGLSNLMEEQEILYEVLHGGQEEDCCQRLLDIALQRGAPDNVTVALLSYNE